MSDAERLRRAIELIDELLAAGFLPEEYEDDARLILDA
ncbi:MAG: hypothetical protein QOG31_874 [Thermoplasmata archaeon]|jgi:hypothetical protein|nr:hypothetical protein [Thermoplasmata archaeon]